MEKHQKQTYTTPLKCFTMPIQRKNAHLKNRDIEEYTIIIQTEKRMIG
jgi:hypothetical protein